MTIGTPIVDEVPGTVLVIANPANGNRAIARIKAPQPRKPTAPQVNWRAFFGFISHQWNDPSVSQVDWNNNTGGRVVGFHQYMCVNLLSDTLTGFQTLPPPTAADTVWPDPVPVYFGGIFAGFSWPGAPPAMHIQQWNGSATGPARAGRTYKGGYTQQEAHFGPPLALTAPPTTWAPVPGQVSYFHFTIWDPDGLPVYRTCAAYF